MIAIRFSAPFWQNTFCWNRSAPASADNGAVYSVFRHPCLYLRLLLWHAKKTAVPALSQLLEQFIRIGAVLLIAQCRCYKWKNDFCFTGCRGMLIGEAASAIFNSSTTHSQQTTEEAPASQPAYSFLSLAAPLMAMALPLMGNRLILGCLQSLEAIFIPNKLLEFGLSNAEALSTYGVLTGMALPFIFFFRQLSPIPLRSFCCPLSQKHRQRQ